MRGFLARLVLLFVAFCGAAAAQVPTDPLSWLGRISSAAHRLNYAGTFTYQSGRHVETSRIVHVVEGGSEYEKLETLDGSPREVVRANDEVQCFLPEQKLLIVDQAGGRRSFPARLQSSPQVLSESYRIKKGEVTRIAGFEAQQIILEPKDDLRYGHHFWAEVGTGLLLRTRLLNERGEAVEQFSFTELRIGAQAPKERPRARYARSPEWKVVNARGAEVRLEDTGWTFRHQLPGFRQVVSVTRQLRKNRGDAFHVVFSDGLAAISVFIEPQPTKQTAGQSGASTSGAFNIHRRIIDDHLVTVLGEVPAPALARVADGMELRKN